MEAIGMLAARGCTDWALVSVLLERGCVDECVLYSLREVSRGRLIGG